MHRRFLPETVPALLSILATALLPACRPPDPTTPPPDAIAVVDGSVITAADVEAQLRRQGIRSAQGQTADGIRRRALDTLIWQAALFERARAEGLENDPELRAEWRRLVARKYEERISSEKPPPEPVPEELIRQHYEATPDRFQIPEQRRARVLHRHVPSRATEDKRREALASAELLHARAEATDSEGFSALVRELSDDQSTRYIAGDRGWLAADSSRWPRQVIEAVFAASPGEVAPLVETEEGFYVVRVEEVRPANRRPLEEVRPILLRELGAALADDRERRWREEVIAAVDVKIRHELLDQVHVPEMSSIAANAVPPGVPSSSSSDQPR